MESCPFRPQLTLLLVLLLITLILTSCATHRKTSKPDGPPKINIDVSKIPNAKPKPEPLSKLGNMPSYKVFGVRYYTLRSSRNYQAVGLASWYGTKFHRRNTSSGEPYNLLGMTAAHKTLPLPTYVKVTNLKNRRSVIVKVNDRGPFVSDRLIDLSYVAAKKLDMLHHGTTRVRIQAIDPYHYGHPMHYASHRRGFFSSPKSSVQLAPKGGMYLQVGAFRTKKNAEQMRSRLGNQLSAPIHIATPSMRNNLYRVRVGPLKDFASVDKMVHRLALMGIESNKVP